VKRDTGNTALIKIAAFALVRRATFVDLLIPSDDAHRRAAFHESVFGRWSRISRPLPLGFPGWHSVIK
jgi:hypothetical protein